MRAVITGAAGFIGSRFAELFLDDAERLGYDDVVLFDALTYSGRRENMDESLRDRRASFVHASITDADATDRALRGAHARRTLRRREPRRPLDRRARARSSPRTCSAPSSCSRARGAAAWSASCTSRPTRSTARSSEGSWREDHVLEPNSPYSSSKAGSDLAALAYHRTYGLDVMRDALLEQLRPAPVPREDDPAVRDQPARRARRSRSTATGSTCATGCTSTTTAGACWPSLESGRAGEIYNIGGGTELTNRELTGAPARAVRRGRVDGRAGAPTAWDTTGATASTGPRSPPSWATSRACAFDEGLAATVRWYQENEEWWRPLKGRVA